MSIPALSIIVPTRLRPDTLDRCLRELNKQIVQLGDFQVEIIVSEDSADNESEKVVERYTQACWTRGPCKGPAANRNHAATIATGKWLLFLDDDVLPEAGFLHAYEKAILEDHADVLEGRMICKNEKNSPFLRMAENRTGGNLFTANLSVRRETFDELAGFDEELVIMEDLEFAHRLRTLKKRISFVPEATVDHPAQPFGLGYVWRWVFHFRWGLLLRYKTGQTNPTQNFGSSLLTVTYNHLLLMLRKTFHLITQHNSKSWVNAWFWQAWGWLTLPFSIPHLWYWDINYRREFRKRLHLNEYAENQAQSTDHILDN